MIERYFRERSVPAKVDVPLSRYTTFQVGGPARVVVTPRTTEHVIDALQGARNEGLPFRLLGSALGYLSEAWPSVARWQPVALATVSAALTLMATTIVTVIARDLRRPATMAGRS